MNPRIFFIAWLASAGAFLAISDATVGTQPRAADAASNDLLMRVGFTSDEAAIARSGQPAVRVLPGSVESEVAVAGAIRIRGNVERLVNWLRDIEAFRRALGSEVVGAIDTPARVENFAAISAADVDLQELERCASGRCAILIPAAYVAKLKEVQWGDAGAAANAARVVQQLLTDYTKAYQSGGDRALGALQDPQASGTPADVFQDLLRRAVPVWQLAYEFAAYLEEFPEKRPAGVEDRFYWTREAALRKPVATLHHVVLQRLPDRSVRLADKQFYASRDIDAALLVGQATPTADGRAFDLVVSVRARVPQAGSLAGRVLRDRVSAEISATFAAYLTWLQRSFALE